MQDRQQPHNHNDAIRRAIAALEAQIYVRTDRAVGYTPMCGSEALDRARPVIEALTDALVSITESVADQGAGLSQTERNDLRGTINDAIYDATYDARHYNEGADPADDRADWLHDCRDQA